MTIEEALGPGPWYGQERVAYLNDAGDLVLMVRKHSWNRGMTVHSVDVVKGSDEQKIAALRRFEGVKKRAA